MSASVDVLAVMDRAANVARFCDPLVRAKAPAEASSLESRAFNLLGELPEARAAVAELIAADKEYDAAHEAGDYLRMKAATERRAAALARVTGGQS